MIKRISQSIYRSDDLPLREANASPIFSTCSLVCEELRLQRSNAPPSGVAGGNTIFTYIPRSKSPFQISAVFPGSLQRMAIMGLGVGPTLNPRSFSRLY